MADESLLTLQDVAALAKVSRPVVSMWRRRPRVGGRFLPFPAPVRSIGGVEQFDRRAVTDWLEETGRGNNPEAALDAVALTPPEDASLDDVITLLCLHAMSGEEPGSLDREALVALADRVDPDDKLLLREVRALGDNPGLLRYVDDLIEASYGPADAYERVMSGRLVRSAGERGFTTELLDLVLAVADAANQHLGGSASLVPPADYRLTRHLRAAFNDLALGDGDDVREHRRRAVINGVELSPTSTATVQVLSLVDVTEEGALQLLDDLGLGLGVTDVGIVIGAGSLLCDRLAGRVESLRDGTLRQNNLAMALRLPRGLWKAAHRQSLGIWILDGGRDKQHFWAGDLGAESIELNDLASDVTGALEDSARRAYRYVRRMDLAPVLTGRAVVPRGLRPVRNATVAPTTMLDRIYAASLTTSEPVPGYDVEVSPAQAALFLPQRSLGQLAADRQVVMKRGSRIDPAHSDPGGSVRVMSADGSTDDIRLDPLEAERLYPRSTRTEPGDVIIAQRPRPMARVDMVGGALVAAPSKIIRITGSATIGPYALAALINELAPAGSEWQDWNVPVLPQPEAAALDAALAAAAAHQELLRTHTEAIKDLTKNLIQGVAAGAVTIHAPISKAG